MQTRAIHGKSKLVLDTRTSVLLLLFTVIIRSDATDDAVDEW